MRYFNELPVNKFKLFSVPGVRSDNTFNGKYFNYYGQFVVNSADSFY
jgi:hypothetical protein